MVEWKKLIKYSLVGGFSAMAGTFVAGIFSPVAGFATFVGGAVIGYVLDMTGVL